MTDIEKLALMQALYLEIGYEVKNGDPDNLRGHVNAHYLDLYDQTGATGFEVRVCGQKVGTYGFNKTRAQPARTETSITVGDLDALRADDSDEFNAWLDRWIAARIWRSWPSSTRRRRATCSTAWPWSRARCPPRPRASVPTGRCAWTARRSPRRWGRTWALRSLGCWEGVPHERADDWLVV